MAESARPFTTFNFKVNLRLDSAGGGIGDGELCSASFAECDGLEMSIEPKTIREGGNNTRQVHLLGPVSYGQLTLKRGMTENFDLWKWFVRVQTEQSLRASGEVLMLASDRGAEDVRFNLSGCLPIKLKAPALKAADSIIAVEEMQLAYATLELDF